MTPEGGETYLQMVCNSCLNPLDARAAREVKWWDRIRFILEDRKYAGNPGESQLRFEAGEADNGRKTYDWTAVA
ncbi:MAG: hypothetical protein C0394_08590 [Syntrophus sp. (in: bacteria)]|nr:hypothetical protein [Syntrophus sp. (in: bacteria)]